MRDYLNELITPDEQKQYDRLYEMFQALCVLLNTERALVYSSLEDDLNIDDKKEILAKYFNFRIHRQNYITKLSDGTTFNGEDFLNLAQEIYSSHNYYSDKEITLNSLDFFESSINFYDEVLAYYNYCLNKTDFDLSIAVCYMREYIYNQLGQALYPFKFSNVEIGCSNQESIMVLNEIMEQIISFCENYYSDIESSNYVLSYDKEYYFSDRVDYDADEFFIISDARYGYTDYFSEKYGFENASRKPLKYGELKKLKAKLAGERISRCIYSLYLIILLAQEIDTYKDVELLKAAKVWHHKLFNRLFGQNSIEDVTNDHHVISDVSLADSELMTAKEYAEKFMNQIKRDVDENDVDTILRNRSQRMKGACLYGQSIEKTSVVIDNQLVKKTPIDDLHIWDDRLHQKIGVKYQKLDNHVTRTMATAEYLYDVYVNQKRIDGFDYSGIAALYFQAFESAYDQLIIEPYATFLEENNVVELIREYKKIKRKNRKNNSQFANEEFFESLCEKVENYLEIKNLKNYCSDFKFHKTMMLGQFCYFWKWMVECYQNGCGASELIKFLESDNCFGKKIDIVKALRFFEDIKYAVNPRNNASHGAVIIGICDVKTDKEMVYDDLSLGMAMSYKNLLYQLLDFFE